MADKVRMPAETDHGTVLGPKASAVVFDPDAAPDQRWTLVSPTLAKMGLKDNVDREIVVLTAFFARIHNDQEFVDDLYQWFLNLKDG